jgi:hypothetical protein
MALEFGKRYTVTAVMQKKHTTDNLDSPEDFHRTTWERQPIEKPATMLYIGKRQVRDGVMYEGWNESDGSHQAFQTKKRHNLYLFVLNEYTNPFYVHPDDVTDTAA